MKNIYIVTTKKLMSEDIKVFKRLEIDLRVQPTIDQRPWLITGILYALVIVSIIAGTCYQNLNKSNLQLPKQEIQRR